MRMQRFQNLIDKLRGKTKRDCFLSKVYGECYYPLYNKDIEISSFVPKIYNQYGKEMQIFFIRDSHFTHNPYGSGGGAIRK